jgi:predicted PurR-regulated permease PerM
MRIRTLENASFLGLVILVTIAFVLVVGVFLEPVFWAIVLVILFKPVHERIVRAVGGRRSLASVLSLLLVTLVVIVPLVGVGAAVTAEATTLYRLIASGEIDVTAPIHAAEQWLPRATELLESFQVDLDRVREGLSNAAVTVSQFVASQAIVVGQSALNLVILFVLTLYLLFFFFRDGDRIIEALIRAMPLGDPRERRLFSRFALVARATVKGTLVVGVVQGTLGGLAFWILGLNAPVLWGVVMTVLSLLPAIGSVLVWGPAAIYLIVTGEVVRGVILIVAGSVIISTIDNVLRPLLVGRDTHMPDYLILLSTLGGIILFGLSGFVIGPVIAALFITVWEMFTEEFGGLDTDVPDVPNPSAAEHADPQDAADATPPPVAVAEPGPPEGDGHERAQSPRRG